MSEALFKNLRLCQRFLLDTPPPLNAALPLIERGESDGQGCHGDGCTRCAGYLRRGPDADQRARRGSSQEMQPEPVLDVATVGVSHLSSILSRPASQRGGGAPDPTEEQTSATFSEAEP